MGCGQVPVEFLIHFGQLLNLNLRIGSRIDCIMNGGAVFRITFKLRGKRQQGKCLILVRLGGIAGGEQFHDLADPLAIELGIPGCLGRGTQKFLKLHGKGRVIPEGEKRVLFHIHDIFLGFQVRLKHGLASNS